MGRLSILFVCLLTAMPAQARSPAPAGQEFERLFAHALDLQQAGDLLGAIETYKSALLHVNKADAGQKYIDRIFGAGESAEGHLLTGIAFLAQRDYSSAKTELERAVKLNPRLPTAHSLFGRALLGLGEQEAGERALRQELELNVNDFE